MVVHELIHFYGDFECKFGKIQAFDPDILIELILSRLSVLLPRLMNEADFMQKQDPV